MLVFYYLVLCFYMQVEVFVVVGEMGILYYKIDQWMCLICDLDQLYR